MNDKVVIGNHSYTIKKTARGGMGMILFVDRDDQNPDFNFGVHRPRLALKGILPNVADERGLALFRRELTVWSAFRHRNVVWLNEILDGEGEGLIAAMDWFHGSLRDSLVKQRTFDPRAAWSIVAGIFDGLKYAYEKDKVLHLDLKPENVLFSGDDYRVSDWGIASIKQPGLNAIAGLPPTAKESEMTLNNFGTVSYMAPERFLKGYHSSVDSDVFSLGMIWLELLTGKTPRLSVFVHPVEMLTSGMYLKLANDLLRKQKINGTTRELILSMLAVDPGARPSYHEFRDLLIEARRSLRTFKEFFFGESGADQRAEAKKREQDWANKRGAKSLLLGMKLEYARTQAINLDVVGRKEEAAAVIETYVQEFLKDALGPIATDLNLAHISYQVAYYIWPQIVYKEWTDFRSAGVSSFSQVPAYPITAALRYHKKLSRSQLQAFQMSQGELAPGIDYVLMTFPKPPPVSSVKGHDDDKADLNAIPTDEKPVTGPYYAVAIQHRDTGERKFFVLGQTQSKATTFRCVTADRVNSPCGTGPYAGKGPISGKNKDFLPDAEEFLRCVEAYITTGRLILGV